MPFARIGSRASCQGSGCNGRLPYGSQVFIFEFDHEATRSHPKGTVLCVGCATMGSPRDLALLKRAEQKGVTLDDREAARASMLLDGEDDRERRAKLWATAQRRDLAMRRKRQGSDESEEKREARCKATPPAELDADDRAFLAMRKDRIKRAKARREADVKRDDTKDMNA